jgi:hypothetical protein
LVLNKGIRIIKEAYLNRPRFLKLRPFLVESWHGQ